mmetsp:Transcript_38684/g.106562  ORF Transcript_38684/g.106562 Transcript_38684/m.106562 type:complete len:307 (-) Transcript_38684:27-947(-)
MPMWQPDWSFIFLIAEPALPTTRPTSRSGMRTCLVPAGARTTGGIGMAPGGLSSHLERRGFLASASSDALALGFSLLLLPAEDGLLSPRLRLSPLQLRPMLRLHLCSSSPRADAPRRVSRPASSELSPRRLLRLLPRRSASPRAPRRPRLLLLLLRLLRLRIRLRLRLRLRALLLCLPRLWALLLLLLLLLQLRLRLFLLPSFRPPLLLFLSRSCSWLRPLLIKLRPPPPLPSPPSSSLMPLDVALSRPASLLDKAAAASAGSRAIFPKDEEASAIQLGRHPPIGGADKAGGAAARMPAGRQWPVY